jgi:hypothetical protein
MATNKTLHSDAGETITDVAEVIEGTCEEAILVSTQKFFPPEFVSIENILEVPP